MGNTKHWGKIHDCYSKLALTLASIINQFQGSSMKKEKTWNFSFMDVFVFDDRSSCYHLVGEYVEFTRGATLAVFLLCIGSFNRSGCFGADTCIR